MTTATGASCFSVLQDANLLRTEAYIDGAWVSSSDGSTFAVTNPSTGAVIAELPSLTREQTMVAVKAADRALAGWRGLSGKDRSKILRRWFDLVTENIDDLAAIITLEEGKPLTEAKAEMAYAASFIEWFAEEAKRVRGGRLRRAGRHTPHRGPQGADRGLRGDHALELPSRDDHPQGRSCPRGWLHHGGEAGRADTVDGARAR